MILWQTGKQAGVYALAQVVSAVEERSPEPEELPYFKSEIPEAPRVRLQVDYNLWDRPLTRESLPAEPPFDEFYAGLPGTNFKATEAHYQSILNLLEREELAAEPEVEYANEANTPVTTSHPLNLLFYGPPGTGKTYQTVNQAIAILEDRSLEEVSVEDRTELRRRFQEYVNMGRISFVTFHPSFAYEDFVEGIKPMIHEKKLVYGVQDGIFKQMCLEGRRLMYQTIAEKMPTAEEQVEFSQLYSAFLEFVKGDKFDHFLSPTGRPLLLHRVLPFGNLALRPTRSFQVETVLRKKMEKLFGTFSELSAIKNPDKDIRDTLGAVNPRAYFAVFRALKMFEAQLSQTVLPEQIMAAQLALPLSELPEELLRDAPKVVLIIDEINRGNISAVLGDLISLLEPNKREGQSEALSVVLPYSRQYLTVPPNLHLIATMNTGDQGTVPLDFALRRRFTFIELDPLPGLLKSDAAAEQSLRVDLSALLRIINQRLERLLDREHRLGHSYFMNIRTLDDLCDLFERVIIPLLEAYFYNDLRKIGLTLGRGFVRRQDGSDHVTFAPFYDDVVIETTHDSLYERTPREAWTEEDFIQIYANATG